MARAFLACLRSDHEGGLDGLPALFDTLAPDNEVPRPPYAFSEGGLFACVHNPMDTVRTHRGSLALGVLDADAGEWHRPGAPRPDGTFALFRADADRVELVPDRTATRTIWYCHTERSFAASTSQRMLVAFLGDFVPSPQAVRWMLGSGTLGPDISWDARIHALPPDTVVRLDRRSWEVSEEAGRPLDVHPEPGSHARHRANLEEAVRAAVAGLQLRPEQWSLALSGGVDSRGILYHLRDARGLQAITWGAERSLEDAEGDAVIAARLARDCGIPHTYARSEVGQIPFEVVLTRFLAAGEGRIDHLSGYLDGMALWRRLSAEGRGILRGYDAFGHPPPVHNEFQARRAGGLALATDYRGDLLPPELAVSEDDLPPRLRRHDGETLAQYRDRLWLGFRTPVITAALDEIKVAYVEIVNPLLCARVVDAARALPDELRTGKVVWREIVAAMFPGVPFARKNAIVPLDDVLRSEPVRRTVRETLRAGMGSSALPEGLLRRLADALEDSAVAAGPAQGPSLRQRLASGVSAVLPRRVKDALRANVVRAPLDVPQVAMRAAIVLRMHALLEADARAGAALAARRRELVA